MTTVETLMAQARGLGATFHVEGDKLKVQAPVPLPQDLLAALRRHKAELLALLKAQHQAGAGPGTEGPGTGDRRQEPPPPSPSTLNPKFEIRNPKSSTSPPLPPGLQVVEADPALLKTPLKALQAPLPVWSALLGELIYLVPDEATAQRLLAEGKVAYYPEEVAILLEIKARWPETWREKVQKIHLAKKEFGGLVTELRM